jgi:hypothetical protein
MTDPQESEPGPTDKLDAAIERVLNKTLGKLLDTGKIGVAETGRARGKAEPEIDVTAQVKAAVAQAQAEDKRTANEKARDEKIAALEAKLANKEQRPREHRPIVKFFGWIHPDDVE